MVVIRKAAMGESKRISDFIDKYFTTEGFGFVTDAQTRTEISRSAVWVAIDNNEIVGVRVGINRVYNLCVHPDYRGAGVGRELIHVHPPDTIRVKSEPVGHLSKAQIENFKSPEGFYKALGYELSHIDVAKNFYQRGSEKANFHKEGKKHIRVYVKPSDLFDEVVP